MKGGILTLLVAKTWGLLVGAVIVFAIVAAVVGPKSAASLAGTTATVGGQSTGIVLGSLPGFFQSIRDGQGLVKHDAPAETTAKSSIGKER